MKTFNTAGPCHPHLHYMLSATERIPDAREYITYGEYFVLHAPRQSGKTTSLDALATQLTAEGTYAALRFSCETAEPLREDFPAVEKLVLDSIRSAARWALPADAQPPDHWPDAESGGRLVAGLSKWAARCPRPLVLFFDEIDALQGRSLISVLRQLRDGYTADRARFVHSIALCGLRDVTDHQTATGDDRNRLTSHPFNITVASIRLADFDETEVRTLYAQHTAETGQEFTTRAVDLAYHYSAGQPWLVNALASEVIRRMKIRTTITDDHIDEAKERLILARATHLDSLVARLNEPRVQHVIEPLIAGTLIDPDSTFDDAVSYLRDLGLIADDKSVRIANPIYNEVIVRVLGTGIEDNVTATPASFRFPDGRLDFPRLLREFTRFWIEHGEILTSKQAYHEVAPQLVLMAYLHRIINGGGFVDREYGLGRGRIDLLIRQPYVDTEGKREVQREAIEIKVRRSGYTDPTDEGLHQLDGYLDRLGWTPASS
ncbi:AAA family ATPase [Nocardia aurantia]|uniref:Orc1-like AAA ATPase domain-containing protein n=1 Tax=Nocardia aurantia TaxID=2585199 RepID=A0A7K0DM00_9NOCA|nr:AAA family ATPase [Nocardia aurantia]MQY26766.1 hypothetical protein [Nocardia aurantia]